MYYVDSGSGPAVVLLHGLPFTHTVWEPQRAALAGYRVITPDLPGLGDSPLPDGPPDLAAVAHEVLSLLTSLNISRAVLGGQSMGGYVVMELLRLAPDLASGLVFLDTRASADGGEERSGRLATADAIEADNSAAVLLGGFFNKVTSSATPDAVRTQVRNYITNAPPAGVAWLQRALAAREPYWDVFASAAVPAAVIVGAMDAITPPDDARAIAEALPNAELTIVPDAGHLANLEQPTAVNTTIGDLLNRVS